MRKIKFITGMIVFCSALQFVSCSARRIQKDMTSNASSNPHVMEGRLVFKNNCQKCHPNGEAGVGLPLNNIHLPGFLLRPRVRTRAFLLWTGKMPAFDKAEISKTELDALVAFLKDMHKKDNKKN